MITFPSGGKLIQDASELPKIPNRISRFIADFETSSGDPKKSSVNPWYDCTAIGAAVGFNDCAETFFIPRHLLLTGWWQDALNAVKASDGTWTNHNVKYDMHVSANDLGVIPKCKVRCTLTGAKLIDSDRGFMGGYGLDALSRDWCNHEIGEFEWRLQPYLKQNGKSINKDYGRIPLDLLAEYACMDVTADAVLDDFIEATMPEESGDVWRTEQGITELLFRMEQIGIHVNPEQVMLKQYQVITRMLQIEEELEKLVGYSFRPHVNGDCYEVLCSQFGLPVLAYTDGSEDEDGNVSEGNPSFDKHALAKYLNFPGAPVAVVSRMIEYRKLNTFNSLFLETYTRLNINGVLHGSYNQTIRTARMSCSGPNMQQLSGMAKELIIPPPGYAIITADYSQIEFRIIVSYIQNQRCIDAYRSDPWTDFHQWVADTVPTRRKPAKTINFMMGYGGGKKKTIENLSTNADVVGDVIKELDALSTPLPPDERKAAIERGCKQRALQVYAKYHELLPELKPTSHAAESACRKRGYARNFYGRRRRLPGNRAHTAFNTVCQSTAGDMIKERMLALDREMPHNLLCAQVHDQVLSYMPLDMISDSDTSQLKRICDIMNAPARPLAVPVKTSIGWSDKNWLDAQAEDREMKL